MFGSWWARGLGGMFLWSAGRFQAKWVQPTGKVGEGLKMTDEN